MLNQGDIAQYCDPGPQTKLEGQWLDIVTTAIGRYTNTHDLINKIQKWKNSHLPRIHQGGKFIGKTTTTDIFERHNRSGCHDDAILVASILRDYKIPTIMLESIDIERAHAVQHQKASDITKNATNKNPMKGHVFLQVYIDGTRQILDSSTGKIYPYDQATKIIKDKYYIIAKGKDPADYGVTSLDDLVSMTASQLDTIIEDTRQLLHQTMK